MKSALWLFSTLLLVILVSFALLYVLNPSFAEEGSLVSPLPSYLTLQKNSQVRLLDLWKPLLARFTSNDDAIASTAKSVLLFDLTKNKALFERNPTERHPMASLTKIMTAIIALENPRKDDAYTVQTEDIVGEDSMGVEAGEILSEEDLLYGLILPSGNDAAEVFASNYPGGRNAFILAMNQKAKALGLTDTNFTNPSGLQGDGDQYTTTADLLVITKYALDNFPIFRRIAATFSHTIEATDTHKAYYLENETNLLTTYPGVKGIKTGYTPEAGLCLVTYLDYDGHQIVGIILNSENRRQEMKELLDYGLKSVGITPPKHD